MKNIAIATFILASAFCVFLRWPDPFVVGAVLFGLSALCLAK